MKEARRLELLLEVGRVLASKLELPELLATVLKLASGVVDAEAASLLLLDPATDELYFDVALGLGPEASKMRLKLGQGIAGTVAQSRTPEIINNVADEPRWSPQTDAKSGFTTRSILAVPIVFKGKLIGVVEALNKRSGPFDRDDILAFEAFASQASVAIDNARLFTSLRDEKFKLATIFSQMHDGAVLTNPQGQIVLANEAAKLLLGGDHPNLDHALAGLTVIPAVNVLLKTSCDFTAMRTAPTLLVITGHVTKAPLFEGDGRLFVFRDDTENQRQEQMKRTFLSLISHKLKTPLASVIGFSDVLLAEFESKSTNESTLLAARTINKQGVKVAELVDKLIRYTTLESPDAAANVVDIDIDAVVSDAVKALRDRIAEKQAQLDYQMVGLTFRADRDMILEVVKNLVENALKFGPAEHGAIVIRADAADASFSVSVTDHGPGLPPESQQAVFSRFYQIEKDFTGQQEGLGLGLAYVRKVAELHGGKSELSSTLGKGTTVSIRWPRASSK